MGESYFKISKDLEPKIAGLTKDGGDQGKIDIQLFKDKLWLNDFLYGHMSELRRGDFPEKEFALKGIWLDKKAKLNDFISVGALMIGFIVNQKVVEILKTCILPPHKFGPGFLWNAFFCNGSYISNRLKKKFETNKIKGFRLNEPTNPILEWE